ncbi:MAG TPA: hypothetical protein PLD43_10355, partial [Anaerolineae bacterium]|nr:hypothetical protein [Anaerolineae bacterium]
MNDVKTCKRANVSTWTRILFADSLSRLFALSLFRLFADSLTADSLISIFEGDAMCWRTPSKNDR